jgi:hypothetical protein
MYVQTDEEQGIPMHLQSIQFFRQIESTKFGEYLAQRDIFQSQKPIVA